MKNKILSVLLVALMLVPCFMLGGCEKKQYTVQFWFVHSDSEIETDRYVEQFYDFKQTVNENSLLTIPDVYKNPDLTAKRNKYYFQGWYQERECITPWAFYSDTVKCDMKLYGKWVVKP